MYTNGYFHFFIFGIPGPGHHVFLMLPFISRNIWQRLSALERKVDVLANGLQMRAPTGNRPEKPP
jgi:hypothetical protein